MVRALLVTFWFGLLLAGPVRAQKAGGDQPKDEGPKGPPPALDADAVGALAERYDAAQHWGVRALVLLALGPRWHPDGGGMVLHALIGRDPRLQAYALEALRRCERGWLKPVASRAIVEELIRRLDADNTLVARRATSVLRRIAPFADGESADTLRAWWREQGPTYRPPPAPDAVRRDGSFEVAYRELQVERARKAVALNADGLDLVIALDTSASMRRTIAGARDAIVAVVDLLRGICPTLRVGLIQFKDHDTLEGGAQRLVPLTDDPRRLVAALRRLNNRGGGDRPEAVATALRLAIDAETGWRRDAAKAVVVIGDAPPHQREWEDLLNLVRAARAGTEERGRWVISAIDVGAARDTAASFQRLARLGGGVYHRLTWGEREASQKAIDSPLLSLLVRSALSRDAGAEQAERLLQVYRSYARAGAFDAPRKK